MDLSLTRGVLILKTKKIMFLLLLLVMCFSLIYPSKSETFPEKYQTDKKHFLNTMDCFIAASKISSELPDETNQKKASKKQEKVENLMQSGLESGNEVSESFLNWLDMELSGPFKKHLLRGNTILLEGYKKRKPLMQVKGIKLTQKFYNDYWSSHVKKIIKKLEL